MHLADDVRKISGEEVPPCRSLRTEQTKSCFRAALVETVDLPPQAESVVSVKANLLISGERWAIIESVTESCIHWMV